MSPAAEPVESNKSGSSRRSARIEEDLYGLPLDDFTSARDGLAARLKDAGDTDSAKAVKALRKPTLPAWTVNQLARRDQETLHRLIELRDELTDTSGPDEIRRLAGERKSATASLLRRAEEILTDGGHSAGASTLDAVAKTLQAGGSEDERVRLLQGTLDRPLSPSGFEGLGGFEAFAPETADEAPAKVDRAAERKAEKLASKAAEAERLAADLGRRAERVRKDAEELERDAESARRKAERARKKADEAL